MNETTQTEQPKNKKFRFWWIIVGIIALLIGKGLGNRIGTEWSKRNASETNERETTVAEEQDDGSLPKKISGSNGEMKTFDCYYIESTYVYDPEDPGRVLFVKGQYSGMDYLCKVYISRERYDTDCVYLHIAVDDFEEVFGENAASTAGASGTIVFNNRDKDTVVFARLYDEPIQITGKIMDSEELGPFNSWFKDISGKTRLMDFISVSY